MSNSTQNDWEKRFWEYYEGRKEKDGYINPSFLLLFIAKELADARREGYEKGIAIGMSKATEFYKDTAYIDGKKIGMKIARREVIGVKIKQIEKLRTKHSSESFGTNVLEIGYKDGIDDALATLREEENK